MASIARAPRSSIRLPRQHKRRAAEFLLRLHLKLSSPASAINQSQECAIRVVCVSDTHNHRPVLPPGDILIHAGDLTEIGSFTELQAGLTWLSEQPHAYKILVAGNHDVLLDEAFLSAHPERRYGERRTQKDLDWGSVIFLKDSSVTLEIESSNGACISSSKKKTPTRPITIFGSPWTPQYGISAFQYHPENGESHWEQRLGSSLDPVPDIVVTHGPPKWHLDARDFYHAGCPYLGDAIGRLKPHLVVFGHIHASYGREDVVFDGARRAYERILTGWAGWETVLCMAGAMLWSAIASIPRRKRLKVTTFVNAAVVGGLGNELRNDAMVVEL